MSRRNVSELNDCPSVSMEWAASMTISVILVTTVSLLMLGLNSNQFWNQAYQNLVAQDVTMGLVKPVIFGFIIATVGCYYGITARGGTQGVGRATTQAMVASSVLIIVVDFFLTRLLMTMFGYR